MKNLIGSIIATIGTGAFVVLSIGMVPGWAYWMWMAIHFGSFGMFLFGLLGPLGLVAAVLGLWSLVFGIPQWLSSLVG